MGEEAAKERRARSRRRAREPARRGRFKRFSAGIDSRRKPGRKTSIARYKAAKDETSPSSASCSKTTTLQGISCVPALWYEEIFGDVGLTRSGTPLPEKRILPYAFASLSVNCYRSPPDSLRRGFFSALLLPLLSPAPPSLWSNHNLEPQL